MSNQIKLNLENIVVKQSTVPVCPLRLSSIFETDTVLDKYLEGENTQFTDGARFCNGRRIADGSLLL